LIEYGEQEAWEVLGGRGGALRYIGAAGVEQCLGLVAVSIVEKYD